MTDDRDMTVAEVLHREVQAERALSDALGRYAGRWVAVRDHQVVADAETLPELMELIDSDDVEAVFEVAREQATACFF